jgi:toxin ParE1/3/4
MELFKAIEYIKIDNAIAARDLLIKSEELLKRLEHHPFSGCTIPEFSELPYRELLVNPYRFFYKVNGQTIWIVAVWHMAQLPISPK